MTNTTGTKKGGDFAAWEQPRALSEEVRTGFRTLRKNLVRKSAA